MMSSRQKFAHFLWFILLVGCTPVEHGGGWKYSWPSEKLGSMKGDSGQKTSTIKVHLLKGGGVGHHFYLSGNPIAFIRNGDTAVIKVVPAEYDLCIGTISMCLEPRATNIALENNQEKCFIYRYPHGLNSIVIMTREVACEGFSTTYTANEILVID